MDAEVGQGGVTSYVHKINQDSDLNYTVQQTAAGALKLYVIQPGQDEASALSY